MASSSTALRSLRALRFDPPGYAKKGARRSTFQSALEQCEQFLTAAREAGYATRPVQLFYALSQAGRAVVTASPRIGNQEWQVHGHGLTASTSGALVSDVTVTTAKTGLFPAVAAALGVATPISGESIAVREFWPLLPEALFAPLSSQAILSVLSFSQDGWPDAMVFSHAELGWIPARVKELYGDDSARVGEYLDHYPSLKGSSLRDSQPSGRVQWVGQGVGLRLKIRWTDDIGIGDSQSVKMAARKTVTDLGVFTYRAADDLLVTPSIGSMTFRPASSFGTVGRAASAGIAGPVRARSMVKNDRHRPIP